MQENHSGSGTPRIGIPERWRLRHRSGIHGEAAPFAAGYVLGSVSNWSKVPVWFRVRVQPGTGPLQRVSTQNPLLKSQHFLLQFSIGVLIVSQHNLYVKYAV